MDVVKGFVVDNQNKDRGAASTQDAILDARDESLKHEREALRMERDNIQREREVFHREKIEREEGRKQLKVATDEQLRQRAASESALRQELQTSRNQMQQRDQNDSRRASVTAQTRRTFELQEKN